MTMQQAKLSPVFEHLFGNRGPDDKFDVIVFHRTPIKENLLVRSQLHDIKKRLAYIRKCASEQKPVQDQLFTFYDKLANKQSSARKLAFNRIGSGVLPVVHIEVTSRTLPALLKHPDVLAILPDQEIHLVHPNRIDASPLTKQEKSEGCPWGLSELGIPRLWNTTKGKDTQVAVLDTGVHGEHEALKGRINDFIIIDPRGRRIKTDKTFDSDQHGTHVCGTIAGGKASTGIPIGVAPQANLLVAGALAGRNTMSTILNGISWAVESGADIVTLAVHFSHYEPLFYSLFDILVYRYGVLPVVAVGNESYGRSSSPGNAPGAFTVGAVGSDAKKAKGKRSSKKSAKPAVEHLKVPYFSSGAGLLFSHQGPNPLITKPDVVAPGVQTYSCIPPKASTEGGEYAYVDGTSTAAAMVAGVAALLMSATPQVPVTDLLVVMKETAEHPGGMNTRPDNRWGYGVIRPEEALKALS